MKQALKYDFFLFDLDGTLTDPQVGMGKSLRYALDAINEQTEITDFTQLIGPPLRDSLRDIFGLEGERNELAVTKYREYFGEKGLFENELYLGVIELLQKLKGDGVKMAIATSKVKKYAERIAEHFGFSQYFDFIGGSEFDGRRGAKAEVIADVLEHFQIGGSPEALARVVMIGDRKYDIVGAAAAGIDSIGVLWGFGSAEELRAAGATSIVGSTEELYISLQNEEVGI